MNKIIPLFFLPISSTIFAACPSHTKTLFQCTTHENYSLELCDTGLTIDYAFGLQSQPPQLALSVARHYAKTKQWKGIGANEISSVSIANGDTIYRVFSRLNQSSLKTPPKNVSGVEVERYGKRLHTFYCDENARIINQLKGIK